MFVSTYENLRNKLRSEMVIETLCHYAGGLFAVGNPGTLQTAAFVLRRETNKEKRENSVGTYFRLVHERDAEAKREAFEEDLKALRSGQQHPKVFHYRQKDFDAIPGRPWVYWISNSLRKLFLDREDGLFTWCRGLSSGNNQRFYRYWWEVGKSQISFLDKGLNKHSKWFPLMKGGDKRRWNDIKLNVINWANDGKEIKSFSGSAIRNADHYFQLGIGYNTIASGEVCFRIIPEGFIFDQSSNAIFANDIDIYELLGILNSKLATWILRLSQTLNIVQEDFFRLPLSKKYKSKVIHDLAKKALEITENIINHDEASWGYLHPFFNVYELGSRLKSLENIENEVNAEVYKLFGVQESDRKKIKDELGKKEFLEGLAESNEVAEIQDEEDISMKISDDISLALSWIYYAAGIAIGRFEVGNPEGLGRGDFEPEVINALKPLVSSEGILVNDPGQPLDLAGRCFKILEVILGEKEASSRVKTALGNGDPLELLRDWFGRFSGSPKDSFWKYHFQLYRKRPVYWPLQSPGRLYTVWVFHERFTRDTLFHIRNNIVEPRLRMAERQIADLRLRSETDRSARKEIDRLRDLCDDLGEFSKRLRAVAEKGYVPHIDDGVLLNAAPLHQLLPSWPETEKAWAELEKGEYDWAQQAMEYWPERVKEKCKTNRSFAIAHGLEELCPPAESDNGREKKRRKKGRPVDYDKEDQGHGKDN